MFVVEKCREKKEKLHLTYAQISEKSGIPLSTVHTFFNDTTKNPSYITVGAICKALGISLDAILGIEDEEMSAEEISRVREESKKNEQMLQQTIHEHAQNILLHESTIESNNETIRRQDLRIKELGDRARELSDRVEYQKKAVTWLRLLSVSMCAYALLITIALIIVLQMIVPRL